MMKLNCQSTIESAGKARAIKRAAGRIVRYIMRSLRCLSTAHRCMAKKTTSVAPKYFGRVSNNLSAGIVGLANVGKSTFFQAITKSTLGNPANYPFATIDAEKALVAVSSPKLDSYQKLFASEKKVPTSLTIYDIAGLTRNAASGQGLGNKFLADIRLVDGIIHLVRGFCNDEITHIENSVDPVRDMTIVTDELILKDLEYIETALELSQKNSKKPQIDKVALQFEIDTLEQVSEILYSGRKVSSAEWTHKQIDVINPLNLLTAKPTVVLLNVTPGDYCEQKNEFQQMVLSWINENCPQDILLLFSAEHETTLNALEGDQLAQHISQSSGSAMETIVEAVRDALHLISFYTCGPQEAHQWLIREGTTVPEAAGAIHTDLQKTFISAQVYKWADLQNEAAPLDEAAMKRKGKQLKVGKLYIVEDGDVVTVKAAGGRR